MEQTERLNAMRENIARREGMANLYRALPRSHEVAEIYFALYDDEVHSFDELANAKNAKDFNVVCECPVCGGKWVSDHKWESLEEFFLACDRGECWEEFEGSNEEPICEDCGCSKNYSLVNEGD